MLVRFVGCRRNARARRAPVRARPPRGGVSAVWVPPTGGAARRSSVRAPGGGGRPAACVSAPRARAATRAGRADARLWSRAQSLKVPMQIYAPITRMPDMVPLIEQHPDLDVVIDHMADCPIDQPEQLEKLLALACYPRVFVKISHLWSISRQPYPWLDAQEYARRCYDAFGPQRLMWGTDWPVCKQWTSYEDTVRVVRDGMPWLNDDDKSWIMSRTVERVWPFAK